MKRKLLFSVVLFLGFCIFSCAKEEVESPKNVNLEELYEFNRNKVSISQGISGTLITMEGNCMPMIGEGNSESSCRAFPVMRKIQIYDYTLPSDVEGYGPQYEAVSTSLIGETESDKDGFFQFQIEPGKYSIFIIEKGKYYANEGAGDGGINPVLISNDSVTIRNLKIDYAVY